MHGRIAVGKMALRRATGHQTRGRRILKVIRSEAREEGNSSKSQCSLTVPGKGVFHAAGGVNGIFSEKLFRIFLKFFPVFWNFFLSGFFGKLLS